MTKIREFFKNKWVRFAIVGGLYLFWVIWMQSWGWLILMPVIFDIYISKKVPWDFWNLLKPKFPKFRWLIEWFDALIFAFIAATFVNTFIFQLYAIPTSSLEKTLLVGDRLYVSKVAFGPRVPQTPLTLPLMHNKLPGTTGTNSYLTWIQNEYKRLAGFGEVQRNDIVVFNFPVGDTIITGHENPDYYGWVRNYGSENINSPKFWNLYYQQMGMRVNSTPEIKTRPVDKRENYVKRCVAVGGDSIQIVDGYVYINGEKENDWEGRQFDYLITTDGSKINPKFLQKIGVANEDIEFSGNRYALPLTASMAEEIRRLPNIASVDRLNKYVKNDSKNIYPFSPRYNWTKDNFGPMYVPKKGATVEITNKTEPIYRRLIEVYEENTFEQKDGLFYINGEQTTTYTFKMNYYWMMGDNRDNSADARMWGFVPEDHVVGKPIFVLFSTDKDKSFFEGIRFNRIFKKVHSW
jgi:signal peptidase I